MKSLLTTITSRSKRLIRRLEEHAPLDQAKPSRTPSEMEQALMKGTYALMVGMARLLERSMDLVESQLEESRRNQEVMELKKRLLLKQLREK